MAIAIPISKPPLTIDQAQGILETLALLTTEQHKTSKIVFYDTKISLEADSSTMRTVYSWTSPVTSTFSYYAGYATESGSRKLSDLPILMERVHAVMTDQRNTPLDYRTSKSRQDFVENAQKGLTALQANRYQAREDKAPFFTAAQATLDKIKVLYKEKSDVLLRATYADYSSKREREEESKAAQMALKDQEIVRLREKIGSLEQLIEKDQKNTSNWLELIERTKQTAEADVVARYSQRIADLELLIATQHSTNENWTQILVAKEQEYSKKLAEKDRLLASIVMTNTVELDKVPPAGILAMVRVLVDTMAARQAQ